MKEFKSLKCPECGKKMYKLDIDVRLSDINPELEALYKDIEAYFCRGCQLEVIVYITHQNDKVAYYRDLTPEVEGN